MRSEERIVSEWVYLTVPSRAWRLQLASHSLLGDWSWYSNSLDQSTTNYFLITHRWLQHWLQNHNQSHECQRLNSFGIFVIICRMTEWEWGRIIDFGSAVDLFAFHKQIDRRGVSWPSQACIWSFEWINISVTRLFTTRHLERTNEYTNFEWKIFILLFFSFLFIFVEILVWFRGCRYRCGLSLIRNHQVRARELAGQPAFSL